MSNVAWFALGVLGGAILMAHVMPATDTSCCQRVAYGARDKIASYTGPFSDVTKGVIDALGLTPHIPALLDLFGVPKEA